MKSLFGVVARWRTLPAEVVEGLVEVWRTLPAVRSALVKPLAHGKHSPLNRVEDYCPLQTFLLLVMVHLTWTVMTATREDSKMA